MKNKTKEAENTNYDSNVTQEDLDTLGKKGLSMDTGDDRLLQQRKDKIDFFGRDLDIPIRDGVNLTPNTGLVDEENTLFGQGGECNENLEAPERVNTDKSS